MREHHYFLVRWPYSQIIMDKEWFNECSLADAETFGYSAYFVPVIHEKEFLNELKKME